MVQPGPDYLVATAETARARFDDYGVIVFPNLLTATEIDDIRKTFTAHVETHTDLGWNDNVKSDDILAKYPRFVHPHRHPDTKPGSLALEYILDKRILDRVTDLIGPAYGAQSMFYFKPPTARGQALHQDNNPLQCHPDTCLACWIAVDDADGENGGLMVIPGTHRSEVMCHDQESDITDSFDAHQVRLPPGVKTVQTQMRAGDALFFNGSLVHGSHSNSTKDRFRRSLIFHYIPQSSQEISKFYHPLLTPEGKEVRIGESEKGGPCGETWAPLAVPLLSTKA